MTTGFGMIVVSLEMALTANVWTSLGAPELIPARLTVWLVVSSAMVKSPIGFKVGKSFTGLTLTVNIRVVILFEPPPSFTITVITADPEALVAGVKVNAPLALGLV